LIADFALPLTRSVYTRNYLLIPFSSLQAGH